LEALVSYRGAQMAKSAQGSVQLCLKGAFGSARHFSCSSGSLDYSAHIFHWAGPNPMKLIPLETRLLKLSRDTYFSQFGPVPTKLWPREVDPAAASNVCIKCVWL